MGKIDKISHTWIGIVSFIFGIYGLIIEILARFILHMILSNEYIHIMHILTKTLNFLSKTGNLAVGLGLVIGVMGLFHKNKRRVFSVLGIVLNLALITWGFVYILVSIF